VFRSLLKDLSKLENLPFIVLFLLAGISLIEASRTLGTLSKLSVLGQLCNLIPAHLVSKLARETGMVSMARSFSPWSHVVCMLFAQLTHAIGLTPL
jgi:hypothetical protein